MWLQLDLLPVVLLLGETIHYFQKTEKKEKSPLFYISFQDGMTQILDLFKTYLNIDILSVICI